MIILFIFLFLIICFSFFFKKENNSFIIINIKKDDIPENIIKNENKLYQYICNHIDMIDFKFQFYNLMLNNNLVIANKVIYDRSLEIPNGEIFKYIFNHESCKMLLKEGIFCEIHFQNKKIPINVLLNE